MHIIDIHVYTSKVLALNINLNPALLVVSSGKVVAASFVALDIIICIPSLSTGNLDHFEDNFFSPFEGLMIAKSANL